MSIMLNGFVSTGWGSLKVICTHNLEGKEKGKVRQQATTSYLGERTTNMARRNPSELPITTFPVVICWVSNSYNIVQSSNQLQAVYTNVRDWEELIDFINKNGRLKEP
jgi:hypothetical protein